jgi:hypothetical protein
MEEEQARDAGALPDVPVVFDVSYTLQLLRAKVRRHRAGSSTNVPTQTCARGPHYRVPARVRCPHLRRARVCSARRIVTRWCPARIESMHVGARCGPTQHDVPSVARSLLKLVKLPFLLPLRALNPEAYAARRVYSLHALRAKGVLKPGTFTLLLSPAGGGQTTLLKALTGQLQREATQAQLAGTSVTWAGLTAEQLAARGVNLRLLASFTDQMDAHLPLLTARRTANCGCAAMLLAFEQAVLTRLRLVCVCVPPGHGLAASRFARRHSLRTTHPAAAQLRAARATTARRRAARAWTMCCSCCGWTAARTRAWATRRRAASPAASAAA